MPRGSGATILPVPCLKLDATNTLTLWALKGQDDLPLFDQSSVHEKMVISKGLLALRRISWREPGEPVVASLTGWALSADGITAPWVLSQAALPALPPTESDFTLDSLSIGGTALEDVSDLEIEFSAPWTPRWKAPSHRYPGYLSSSAARGICEVTATFKSSDRSLLRAWGPGFKGAAIDNFALVFRDYAQAAERGITTIPLSIAGTVEVSGAEDGRPSSVQVKVSSLSTDGSNPTTW